MGETMRQLFSVGEEVILCSKNHPQYNGAYIVDKVVISGEKHTCRITGQSGNVRGGSSELGYLLNVPHLDAIEGVEIAWSQSALRKKHKPSTESFSEMMRNLNTIKV